MSALDIVKERRDYLAAFPDVHFAGAWTGRNEQDFAVWLAAKRAAQQPSGGDGLTDDEIIELHDSMYPSVPFDRAKIMGNVVRFTRAAIAAHIARTPVPAHTGTSGEDARNAVREAFHELVKKNTHRKPRIVGNDVEYRNEIDTYQIGREVIDAAIAFKKG